MIKNNRKKESIHKNLEDDKGKELLETRSHIFELILQNNVNSYFYELKNIVFQL